MNSLFNTFSIEDSQINSNTAQILKSAVKNITITKAAPQINEYLKGKHHLHIKSKKGKSLSLCASLNEKYICCGIHVLNTISNCPFKCSYCFLQNYLTDSTVSVIGNINSVLKEIKKTIEKEPKRLFRIGTWELGDSLALEHLTGQAKELIIGFSKFNNAVLDLRTKSKNVDQILSLDHHGKTIVSWTLNPQNIIKMEEKNTACLASRILAMKKTVKAGYLIGLHFDPMILYPNWKTDYINLIREVFTAIPVNRIAWISLGSLRFNPEMKKKIEANFPDSKITTEEMILGNDHKMRYIKPNRINQYKTIYQAIRKYGAEDIFVYLCMERWDMWDKIFGFHPQSITELDYLFTKSLKKSIGK